MIEAVLCNHLFQVAAWSSGPSTGDTSEAFNARNTLPDTRHRPQSSPGVQEMQQPSGSGHGSVVIDTGPLHHCIFATVRMWIPWYLVLRNVHIGQHVRMANCADCDLESHPGTKSLQNESQVRCDWVYLISRTQKQAMVAMKDRK